MSRLTPQPTRRYPPVGRCIYCGCSDKRLTDEHPIPLALGGNLVLPDASCEDCAKETHKYEGTTLRSTLGNLRIRLGFPTRRKKERPSHIEIGTILPNGSTGKKRVPFAEYPVGVAIPHFGRAGIFLGSNPELDTLKHLASKMYLNGDLKAFTEKYNWDGKVLFKWMPIEFGQMVMKICYSYAVAEMGVNSFSPLCLEQILSKNRNISYFFGQNGINDDVGGTGEVWKIELYYLLHTPLQLLVVANFSLIPHAGTPIYEVVLGSIKNREQLAILHEYMLNGRLEIKPRPIP